MQQQQPSNQPIITDEFIVKVKLLSNEVYEFLSKTTKVSDLKRMILDKINVPLDKQRIIFGAKQLQDDNKVTEYVKESGLTVHLVARIGGPENTNQNNNNNTQSTTQNATQPNNTQQQPQTNPQPNQQTQPPNPFENILRGFGLGGNMPAGSSVTINASDLGGFGGLLGSLGLRIPSQGPTQPQQRPPQPQNVHNNPFQTPPTNTQRQSQQPQQPTSSFNLNQTQQQQPPSNNQPQQNTQFYVSNEPILRLNETITTLNLPAEPVLSNQHMSLRQQTAQYLRRLQHQYMRMIPQLNRTVQLLNEGRVSHLTEVLRLFEAIDGANLHAQESIRRLINLPANQANQPQNQQQPQSFFSQVPTSLINQPNTLIQGVQIQVEEENEQIDMNQNTNDVQATIIIQQNQIDDSIDEEPTVLPNQSQSQPTQQNRPPQQSQSISGTINLGNIGGLSSLLQGLTGMPINQGNGNQHSAQQQQPPNMMGGLNIGGLMSMLGGLGMNQPQQRQNNQPAQSTQQTQSSTQATTNQQSTQQQQPQQVPHVHGPGCNHHHPPQQQQVPQQIPQFDMSNLASMASMLFNPQQQPSQTSNQPQQQQQNPMGGLMGMFSSLQQSGGMGELLNTSLGETLQEGSDPTVYSAILKSFTGSDILTCFTTKNFDFLDRKYDLVRSNFLNAIAIAGSQEELVEKVSSDIANLLIPRNNVNDYENCLQQVRAITHRHVSEVVSVTMNRGDARYSEKMTSSLKKAFCEAIEKVVSLVNPQTLVNGQSATQMVFHNLKVNSIQLMDEFIQGLSGMFYGFIERDLIRIYNEHREDQKRKQQRSNEQIASEEELLKQIEIESKKDIDYLKNFKHSEFYLPKNE